MACAVAIQRGMAARNAEITRGRRILFRIGLNYGDVIVDGDGIYGNGVNVAVRLEALADPGGVFISGGAREQVRADASHRFASLGERPLKNIAEPVTVYRVVFDPHADAAPGDLPSPPPAAPAATALPPCPYRGLFAFREEDASCFFGRQDTIDELQAAVDRRSLVAVLGASGSGKSSVVFAGLVPRLRAAGGWLIAAFRPDRTPLRNLLAALLPLRDGSEGEAALRDEIDAWHARVSDGQGDAWRAGRSDPRRPSRRAAASADRRPVRADLHAGRGSGRARALPRAGPGSPGAGGRGRGAAGRP